ncbi:uncharacterized protein LOC130797414 [Amaranthus tricolor]|uniref:uncharacterized protein LOC130797414 n=1 Tax=Amaranthus tricolor TaxID=29722 RepID=UPI0025860C64|nr:uncharacterized protein LOC130797414 [Amaranthus tricolor]
MKTDKKPPLAKSPMRIRGRRSVLKPSNTNTPFRTPVLSTKFQMKESENRPEFAKVSCELRALQKMVQMELGAINSENNVYSSYPTIGGSNLFERGRFYDVYSEKRNERLRMKKQNETVEEESKSAYNLGVKADSTKKKESKKKCESLKKTMMAAATYSVDRSQHPRYALRSTTKKPPLPSMSMDVDEKLTTKRTISTRSRKK